MADLNLSMPAVPEGFCNSLNDANWVQTLMNLIAQGVAKFEGSGFTTIISQSTAPGINDRDKLWHDPDVGRIYKFTGGAWISPHSEPAGGNARRWWVGTLTELETYDGGDAGAAGANSGPMWEEDTDFRGRSPMGPGAIPSANPAKTLAIDENFGEGAHTQTIAELVPHVHGLGFTVTEVVNDSSGAPDPFPEQPAGQNTESTGGGAAMPVIHPVRGIYLVKRTSRVNFVGA